MALRFRAIYPEGITGEVEIMRNLVESNHALGDREALDRIWEEQGYWFFRDVLDKDALNFLKDAYMGELKALDLVDADAPEPMWNGRPIENFPATFHSLHERKLWQQFVKQPKIEAFFEDVLDDVVTWIPMDYYRVVAPKKGPAADKNIGLHQDGMSNPGMEFVTCWMPLADIDEKVGGLVIAAGQEKRGYMSFGDGTMGFTDGPIPEDSWSTAHYRPGDVVIFTRTMPHYGAGNSSDRFRLSLDIRAVRASSKLPVIGIVKSISVEEVVILIEDAVDITLRLDDKTFIRKPDPKGANAVQITRSEVVDALPAGTPVMATEEDGLALVLRPQN